MTLVAWGCYMQMSTVDEAAVKKFIKTRSMHGPEGHYSKIGKYTHALIKKAIPPAGSDINDSVLCPN